MRLVVFNQMSCVTIFSTPQVLVYAVENIPLACHLVSTSLSKTMKASILLTQTCPSVPKVLEMRSRCLSLRHCLCPPSTLVPLLPCPPAWQSLLPFIPALCFGPQASPAYISRAVRRRRLPLSEVKHWIMSPAPEIFCWCLPPSLPTSPTCST